MHCLSLSRDFTGLEPRYERPVGVSSASHYPGSVWVPVCNSILPISSHEIRIHVMSFLFMEEGDLVASLPFPIGIACPIVLGIQSRLPAL